jgi:hypothetical protein
MLLLLLMLLLVVMLLLLLVMLLLLLGGRYHPALYSGGEVAKVSQPTHRRMYIDTCSYS